MLLLDTVSPVWWKGNQGNVGNVVELCLSAWRTAATRPAPVALARRDRTVRSPTASCQAVGRADLVGKSSARRFLASLCTKSAVLFQSRTRHEWVELLSESDACCEPVYDIGETLNSAPVQIRKRLGGESLLPPVRLSVQGAPNANAASSPGQHTDACLSDLGHRAETIDALRARGIV